MRGARSELVPAATYLRSILSGDERYSARWRQYARRMASQDLNIDAVSNVLVSYRWSEPADYAPTTLRSMKDRVRRALRAETLTPDTLELFIDAFDIRAADADQLRRLLFNPTQDPAPAELRHRTLSLHELHVLGPTGMPIEHRTLHTLEALVDDVASYSYRFDTPDVVIEATDGTAVNPISAVPDRPGFWQVLFEFREPMRKGEIKVFEYVTTFNYSHPPLPQFRRGAGSNPLASLSMRVRFDPACLPRCVTWARWSDPFADRATRHDEVQLDGDFAAHRFVQRLHNEVVGFAWDW